jgi:hypothetical protein
METKKESKIKKYRLDIIVISAILLVSVALLGILTVTKKEGDLAVVEIDGKTVAKYPLDVDGVFPLNGGTNILVIENGSAYLNYSSCPDHVCENTGKIRSVGETIVCLPNRVTITVVGDSDDGVDLIS